jgi:hypothetical protein
LSDEERESVVHITPCSLLMDSKPRCSMRANVPEGQQALKPPRNSNRNE